MDYIKYCRIKSRNKLLFISDKFSGSTTCRKSLGELKHYQLVQKHAALLALRAHHSLFAFCIWMKSSIFDIVG